MSAISAILYREGKIRATNMIFVFWDFFYPLCYLLVFGVGMSAALGAPVSIPGVNYNSFFLAGVLGMASFGIASNNLVVLLHGPRQWHLLRNAHLPDEPRRISVGQGGVQPVHCRIAGTDHARAGRVAAGNPLAPGFSAAALRYRHRRNCRLVFLLHNFRAAHPPQRRL